MVNLAVEDLDANNKAKETIALELKLLEESRVLLMQKLEQEDDDPNDDEINLSSVCARIGGPLGATLMTLRTRLRDLLTRIQEINEANSRLVHHSIENIRWTVNMMRLVETEAPTYEATGYVRDEDRTGRMVSREL